MLRLHPKRSRIERSFMVCCHTAALFALTLTELPGITLVLLATLIGASLMRFCRNTGMRSSKRIHAIMIGQQHCLVKFAHAELVTELPSLEFFSEYLILLQFKSRPVGRSEQRIRLLLLPDSLNDDEDRCLRRYLRFYAPGNLG